MNTADTDGRVCALCPANGQVDIVAETAAGYVVQALDETGQALPGCYLIVPRFHVTTEDDLPAKWWQFMCELLKLVPGWTPDQPRSVGYDFGAAAGQRNGHMSFPIIWRSENRKLASHGLGLRALIGATDALAVARAKLLVVPLLPESDRTSFMGLELLTVSAVVLAALNYLEDSGYTNPLAKLEALGLLP